MRRAWRGAVMLWAVTVGRLARQLRVHRVGRRLRVRMHGSAVRVPGGGAQAQRGVVVVVHRRR